MLVIHWSIFFPAECVYSGPAPKVRHLHKLHPTCTPGLSLPASPLPILDLCRRLLPLLTKSKPTGLACAVCDYLYPFFEDSVTALLMWSSAVWLCSHEHIVHPQEGINEILTLLMNGELRPSRAGQPGDSIYLWLLESQCGVVTASG